MKNKTLLIATCLCLATTAVFSASRDGTWYEPTETKSKYDNVELIGNNPPLTMEVINPYADLGEIQLGTLVEPFELSLFSPLTVTEPVKRTYRYVFIKRFNWRCQKK